LLLKQQKTLPFDPLAFSNRRIYPIFRPALTRITKAFIDESQQLEATRLRYERNLEWRELFMRFMSYVIAIGSGILTGYCMQH